MIVKCSNNIAEAAQQLCRGDKKRAQGVLDWLVDESCRKEQNKAVIKHWLEAYNKKTSEPTSISDITRKDILEKLTISPFGENHKKSQIGRMCL
jgi:hypothetical protein